MVLLIGSYAVKIAYNKMGHLSNISEYRISLCYPEENKLLNPPIARAKLILFSGWVQVMDRCQTVEASMEDESSLFDPLNRCGIDAEISGVNIGLLKGRLVVFDYA